MLAEDEAAQDQGKDGIDKADNGVGLRGYPAQGEIGQVARQDRGADGQPDHQGEQGRGHMDIAHLMNDQEVYAGGQSRATHGPGCKE